MEENGVQASTRLRWGWASALLSGRDQGIYRCPYNSQKIIGKLIRGSRIFLGEPGFHDGHCRFNQELHDSLIGQVIFLPPRVIVIQPPFSIGFQDEAAPCGINRGSEEAPEESSVWVNRGNDTISEVIECVLPGRRIILLENGGDLAAHLVAQVFHNIRAIFVMLLIDCLAGNACPLGNLAHGKDGFRRIFQREIEKRLGDSRLRIDFQKLCSFLLLRQQSAL